MRKFGLVTTFMVMFMATSGTAQGLDDWEVWCPADSAPICFLVMP